MLYFRQVLWATEKNLCSNLLGRIIYRYLLGPFDVKDFYFGSFFFSFFFLRGRVSEISQLLFSLDDISRNENGILKFLTFIVSAPI